VGWVCALIDPADYFTISDELQSGEILFETRKKLSAKAFGHTAQYDTCDEYGIAMIFTGTRCFKH